MKKRCRLLTALCLLLCLASGSLACAEVQAYLNQPMEVRTGPGADYLPHGSFLSAGDPAVIHTRVWDSGSGQWWVQVDFNADGLRLRAYTEAWRLDADLTEVPEEAALESCYVLDPTTAYAGPGHSYMQWSDPVPASTEAVLMEVEFGWGLIQCSTPEMNGLWRGWVPLDTISCCSCWQATNDTYPSRTDADPDGAALIVTR